MMNIYLKQGREKPVRNGHPWIFSGAIQRVDGRSEPGEPCRVHAAGGALLGHGYYNGNSSITVRMLTRGDLPFSPELLRTRLEHSFAARETLSGSSATDSYRLVNSEGDFLPGLIVDRYGSGLCVQILTAGMEKMRREILAALSALPLFRRQDQDPAFIFERSDTEACRREGIVPHEGLLQGLMPAELAIRENGISILVDLALGQKTGFFFDQRENRELLRRYAAGRRCLDCFAYSGGFSLNALAGGAASVIAVDSSQNAVERCGANFTLNGFTDPRTSTVCADIFDYLRNTPVESDLIVLDPPKFARHQSEVAKAARGYKDINLLAMKKMRPGGLLFTFSCSSAVDSRLFRQIVFAAASDSGRDIQLLHLLSAGPDHPVSIAHPEGEYLKGLVLRVL